LFFEGSEKKVEIWFDSESLDLRKFERAFWDEVVAASKATILSTITNEHLDAYLLSESSLFVYKNSLTMITCGTTSLVHAVETILKRTGVADIALLTYERKDEMAPQDQPSDFAADVALISNYVKGETHRFGTHEGHHIDLFYFATCDALVETDMTLEILMHGMSDKASKVFYKDRGGLDTVYAETGIHQIFPDFQADDFLFDPMGYSVNAIGTDEYYTFHVTPQDKCAYTSFETNRYFTGELDATVLKVLRIFQPKSFACLLFVQDDREITPPEGYTLRHAEKRRIGGYNVSFCDFKTNA
jgi:S-adenosylmethionine decarboxylase